MEDMREQIDVKANFGARVVVTHEMKRRTDWHTGKKHWKRYRIASNEAEGVLIGGRWLQEGQSIWDGDIWYWKETGERIFTYLVAVTPYQNPIYVPVDGLRLQHE